MSRFGSRSTADILGRRGAARDWARVAMRFGLLLTEPRFLKTVSSQFRDRVEEAGDTVTRRLDDAAERLEAARDALRGRSHWASHLASLAAGIGVGAGLAILLAPASGEDTRRALRETGADVRNRASEAASAVASRFRASSSMNMPPTGTTGD